MNRKIKSIVFKFLAVIIPFYVVYYSQLHDNQEKPEIKILWRYVFFGFLLYFLLAIIVCDF